jgi:hypothetical protein
MANYSQWFVESTSRAAREAFRTFQETGCAEHWFYYKPNGLEFSVAQSKPEGFELVTGERVPSDRTIDALAGWMRDRAARVPVLPGDR